MSERLTRIVAQVEKWYLLYSDGSNKGHNNETNRGMPPVLDEI